MTGSRAGETIILHVVRRCLVNGLKMSGRLWRTEVVARKERRDAASRSCPQGQLLLLITGEKNSLHILPHDLYRFACSRIFSPFLLDYVEPPHGSTAGGTELHITGAGFAYVTQVLIGGKECQIFEPMTKDGELMCFSPALPQLSGRNKGYEVEVWFTSGHRAQWRGNLFRTYERYTPYISRVRQQALPVMDNVTWSGDLLKTLELNQREIFEDTGTS
eukprot:s193_g10.t1